MDEVPEEGLDVPLRLEKMANQVTYQRLRAALTVGGCPHWLLMLERPGCTVSNKLRLVSLRQALLPDATAMLKC